MNWHAIASFALGFALMPATIGLIGLFAFLAIHFNLSKSMSAAGSAAGIAVLILVAACGLAYAASRS